MVNFRKALERSCVAVKPTSWPSAREIYLTLDYYYYYYYRTLLITVWRYIPLLPKAMWLQAE